MENSGFLKNKYGNLHTSPEVKSASSRTEKRTGDKISQNPEKQIQNYLDRFKEILDRNDPEKRKQGIEALRKILHENLIIKDEDINYEYFLKQEQLIAEQQGHGILGAPDDFNERKKKEIQNDQKNSLDYWINYLSSPDATYPDWAKYWAFRSMTEMGGYNKKEGRFSKRNKDSAQAFPTLNAGCLADVIGGVIKKQKNEDLSDLDPKFKELLTTENFSKLYTYALEKFGDLKWENLENIRGYWKTYRQGTSGKILSTSLQGYPLEWCTRNEETADAQLKGGDFHVYYSEDSSGIPKIPRLAIRMDGHRNYDDNNEEVQEQNEVDANIEIKEEIRISKPVSGGHTIFENLSDEQKKIFGLDSKESEDIYNPSKDSQKYSITKDQFILDKSQTIGEIRGVEAGQNIDQFIQPVLDEKLKEFGKEGKVYLKKSGDMKEMTRVTEKHRTGQVLNNEDLRFLYEVDSKIEGFGYQDDPRIKQILKERNSKEDLKVIFNVEGDDNKLAVELTKKEDLIDKYIILLENLNSETAGKIIKSGNGAIVSKNFKRFVGLDQNDIVLKIIESGDGDSVARNLKKFEGLSQEIALKLIESENGIAVSNNLNRFNELSSDVALKLIESGGGVAVLNNLEKFVGVDSNEIGFKVLQNYKNYWFENDKKSLNKLKEFDYDIIFQKIIDKPDDINYINSILNFINYGGSKYILDNFDKINNLDRQVASKLIKGKYGHEVAYNIEKFPDKDHFEIFNELVENNYGQDVACNIEKFSGHTYFKRMALEIIESGMGQSVINNLEKFKGVDHSEIVLKLIELGEVQSVVGNLEKFVGLNFKVSSKLISLGRIRDIANNIEKFIGIDQTEIVLNLLKIGDYNSIRSVTSNLEKFNGLSPEVAIKLIELGECYYVAKCLENFQGLDYNKIALKLIEKGEGSWIAVFLEKFKGIDHCEIALKIINAGKAEYVGRFINKFNALTPEVINKLIELKQGGNIAYCLEKFEGLDYNDIAIKLIESGEGQSVAGNLEKFKGIDHYEIALKIIEKGKGYYVIDNFEKFNGLDHEEIILKLIESGIGGYLANHFEKFIGINEKTKEIFREKYPEYADKIK